MSSLIPSVKQRNFRINLVLIFLAFAAPVVAAYLSFYFWPPQGRTNYGELIKPAALPDAVLRHVDGRELTLTKLRGKWLIVTVDGVDCNTACDQKLYLMRQVRISLSKEMNRVERVLLVRGPGNASVDLLKRYPGMHVFSGADAKLLEQFPAASELADHIYLVDPLGNVMMRYPKNPDAAGLRRDLSRLLSVSQVG
jgi:cytochrome oxidase Cu insertion factor (SCO1/SenC/PrrC family)